MQPAGTSYASWWSPSNTSIHAVLRAAVGQLWGLSHSARARDPRLTHRRRQVARAHRARRALATGAFAAAPSPSPSAKPLAISDQRAVTEGQSVRHGGSARADRGVAEGARVTPAGCERYAR